MAIAHRLRALATIALLGSLGLQSYRSAQAAPSDREVRISVNSGAGDVVSSYTTNPPKGYAGPTFNDSGFTPAYLSPCVDPSWLLPEGAHNWVWAGACTNENANVVLRRTFIIPAATVLSARMWIAVHGAGVALVNGQPVAASSGDSLLVDVTGLLHANGAKNVLTILGTQTDGSTAGIAYNLQLFLSGNQVAAYTRLHPNTGNGTTAVRPPSLPPPTTPSACTTSLPTGIVPIFSPQFSDKATSTGLVRAVDRQNVYVVTRQINPGAIGGPNDMPSVQLGGQTVHATAFVTDDKTGEQVLILPSSTNLTFLDTKQPHNQPIGQSVQVYGYSRTQSCLVSYSARVQQYVPLAFLTSQLLAQIDTIPFQDGAEGGVVLDAQGNYLGSIYFNGAVVDSFNQPLPLIAPAVAVLPNVDYLIGVLQQQQVLTASEHLINVVVNADGTQGIARVDGPQKAPVAVSMPPPLPTGSVTVVAPPASPTPSATGSPAPSATPAASTTPGM